MFSKFDVQISSEELRTYEPTQADREEYQQWLEEQEASEPQLDAEDWNAFDGHNAFYQLDFYDEVELDEVDMQCELAEYEYHEANWEELESDDGHLELYEEKDIYG